MFQVTQEHIDLWHRGCSCQFIANRAGVHRMTICRAFHKLGFDLLNRPRPNIDEIIIESRRLGAAGFSRNRIAEMTGYSTRQISRWLSSSNKPA
jgi:transposase